jgi:hypothetical protein
MKNTSKLRYVKNAKIDYAKWNDVIDNADNMLGYANTCYLDVVSEVWDAFVYGDYEYVMPLTITKRVGMSLLQQPLYCQQLGIFPTPSPEILQEFIEAMRNKFKYANINLNSSNKEIEAKFDGVTQVKNFLLDLSLPYDEIIKSYSNHTLRHLKKAYANNLEVKEYVKVETYLNFIKNNQDKNLYTKLLKTLKKVSYEMLAIDKGHIYGVFDKNNEMCAAAMLFFGTNRLIYTSGVSNKRGKELNAMYFFIDKIIKENAGSDLIFDFEGSRIPGIARFFEGFGAKYETYFSYKYNNLAVPFRWLKK